jgi:hypothetical protein
MEYRIVRLSFCPTRCLVHDVYRHPSLEVYPRNNAQAQAGAQGWFKVCIFLSIYLSNHLKGTQQECLVGGLVHFLIFHILGMSSSQLAFTPSIFRGVGLKPPTRCQYWNDHVSPRKGIEHDWTTFTQSPSRRWFGRTYLHDFSPDPPFDVHLSWFIRGGSTASLFW